MIRFAVISLSTLGILGALFFILVWHAQPRAATGATSSVPTTPTPVATTQSADGLGPGSKPWMISYDEKGKIVSKFTADDFAPQTDGSFLVKNPISIFYLDRGQVMRVTGDQGRVFCDSTSAGASKGVFSAPTAAPRTGWLHQVRIELYPSPESTKPTQWMEADNIHFDNDHLRMWTDSVPDGHGNTIASDQVPVTIRGEQYEFDGKGLTLIWNGVSRRLEELQIMHGHRLVIKDPSKLALPGMAAPEPVKQVAIGEQTTPALRYAEKRDLRANEPGSSAYLRTGVGVGSQLASTDRSAVTLVAQPTTPPANGVQPPTPYRAVFHDNVKIDDGGRTMATADLMVVDFLQGSNNARPQAAPAPTQAPASSNAPTNPPTVQTPVIQSPATKPATTKPINGPVTIYWTGPLMVTPLRGEPMMPLAAGQSIVKLVGSPVKLTPEGSVAEAAAAVYRSPDGAARLESSTAIPHVHLTQVKGLELFTERIDYDPATSLATLSGPSALRVMLGTKPMDVTWSRTGVLHVVRLPGQPNGVNHVDLMDDVDVRHPQFTLDSRELQLDLDLIPRPAGQSTEANEQLKLLTAIDNVRCRMIPGGESGAGKTGAGKTGAGNAGDEGIDSDKLEIHTERAADNSTVPREVDAFGHVNAFDPEQGIKADFLRAMLLNKPKSKAATNPVDEDLASAIELESLYARSHVQAHLKTGATADTDELHVTGPEGNRLVVMNDARGSTLTDGKKSSLASAAEIRLTPDAGGVVVAGPGVMKTVRTPSTRPSAIAVEPQPMEVSWRDSMSLESKANVADLYGMVKVVNHDLDGTTDTVTGDKCHIDLVDTPKNDKRKPATQPDAMAAAMGGKDLKKLTLTGHVVGYSELDGPDGTVLRRGKLSDADQLVYTAANGLAVVPGAGKLFVENHKPDSKEGGSNRGEMAIEWKKKLTYNQLTQIINIDGDTVTGFEQEPKTGKPVKPQAPMQLYAQHLVITLTKGQPAGSELAAAQGKMQLSQMQAFDQVRFIAPTVDLTCGTVIYDPLKSLLTAKGTEREPGETRNAAQTVTGTFDELEYDTLKEEVVHVKGSHLQMRH